MEHDEPQPSFQELQSLSAALVCLAVVYLPLTRLPRGLLRVICVLPCLPILARVPFSTRAHVLRAVISFVFLWVCPSKLLLRCWDIAADYPGDSFLYFITTSLLPLRIKGRTHQHYEDPKASSAHTYKGALFLPLLYLLGFFAAMNVFWSSTISGWVQHALYCLFVYLGLEGVLGLLPTLTSLLLRVELYPFFDKPFLASSLAEFWGRRWNRLASYMLRETVYAPLLHLMSAGSRKHVAKMHSSPFDTSKGSSPTHVVHRADVARLLSTCSNGVADASNGIEEKVKVTSSKECRTADRAPPLPARAVAMLASFIASGLIHELIFCCITQTNPTWEVTMFFILHGVATVVEVFLRREFPGRKRLPRPIAIVCTLAFLYFSAAWLFMPPITRSGADLRILAEYRYMQNTIVGLFSRH